jgi:hypothetical protein
MKLGLHNYAVIIPIYSIYIKFNNNKTNGLQTYYNSAKNYINRHKSIQRLSQHNLKMSNHLHIQNLR